MSFNKSLWSSTHSEYETPDDLFANLDQTFHFTLDVCATSENAKCPVYFSPEVDGLKQSWTGHVCWMNPPYGRQVGAWVRKAYYESRKGAVVVALLPSRTDTKWWHDYVLQAHRIWFLRGRLKFKGMTSGAPFPSVIALFVRPQSGLMFDPGVIQTRDLVGKVSHGDVE